MSKYIIETGVELPSRGSAIKSELRKTISALDVGQSIMIPCVDEVDALRKTNNRVFICAQRESKQTGHKYTLRKMPGGIRIWRIQ